MQHEKNRPASLLSRSSAISRSTFYLLGLVVLWAALYLPNLRTSPPWYGDETYVIHNCKYIFLGDFRNFALKNTFLHVTYPYQLPYSYVCGAFYYIFGQDILGPRFFNTLLGLVTACIILVLGKRHFGEDKAFISAVFLLSHTQSVIHYRYVFAHNLVGLGLLTTTLLLYEKSSPRADTKAGLGIMLAGFAHPLVTHVAISALIARLRRPKAWIFLGLPYAVFLSLFFAVIYMKFGNTFAQDLSSYFQYYGASSSNNSQNIISNVWIFFSQDLFHIITFVSLFFFFSRRNYILAICTLVPSLLLLQNRGNLTVFYYQAMLVLPNFCCIFGITVTKASDWFVDKFRLFDSKELRMVPPLCIALLWIVPNVVRSFSGNISPMNAYWTTQNYRDVEEAAKWINAHTGNDDLVIANMNLGWLLHSKSTHLLQVAAWQGYKTHGFENGISRERFIFDADITKSKYVVLGDIDFRWTMGEVGVKEVLSEIDIHQWPHVWSSGTYHIYENPNLDHSLQNRK